jgi:hypothetical protein
MSEKGGGKTPPPFFMKRAGESKLQKLSIFVKLPCMHPHRAKNGSFCNRDFLTPHNYERFNKLAVADAL